MIPVSASSNPRRQLALPTSNGNRTIYPVPKFMRFPLWVWVSNWNFESCFWYSSALWGYFKTALKWIFLQSAVFLFTRWQNYSVWGLLLIYNLTNNNLGNHPNIGIYWVSMHMFRRWGPLNLIVSGAEFHAACINKCQSF